MAEQSKFAGALGRLKQPAAPVAKVQTPAEQPTRQPLRAIDTPTPTGGRGGKRSDPAYSPTTFFVRKETKRKAARLLEDQESSQDLSDLVEQLLSEWIGNNSHV
jgi:hypothetical protein